MPPPILSPFSAIPSHNQSRSISKEHKTDFVLIVPKSQIQNPNPSYLQPQDCAPGCLDLGSDRGSQIWEWTGGIQRRPVAMGRWRRTVLFPSLRRWRRRLPRCFRVEGIRSALRFWTSFRSWRRTMRRLPSGILIFLFSPSGFHFRFIWSAVYESFLLFSVSMNFFFHYCWIDWNV